MRIFLDTEFNGFRGDLLSVGAVDEAGNDFYAVVDFQGKYEEWVRENVVPHIGHSGMPSFPSALYKAPLPIVRKAFIKWVSRYKNPEFVVDWPSDPLYIYQLFLGDNHLETKFQEFSVQVKNIRSDSYLPHNSLEDAWGTFRAFSGNKADTTTMPAFNSRISYEENAWILRTFDRGKRGKYEGELLG